MQSKQLEKKSRRKVLWPRFLNLPTLSIVTIIILGAGVVVLFLISEDGGGVLPIAVLVLAVLVTSLWAWKLHRFLSEISAIVHDTDTIPAHLFNGKKTSLFQKLRTALVFLSDKTEYQQRKSSEQKKELTFLNKELSVARTLLDQVSYFDLNTGVISWSHFKRELNKEIIRSAREGLPLCLLMIRFLNYRQFVHSAGDKVAKEYFTSIANMIIRIVRVSDLVFLHEDDTFALVLPATGRKAAQMVLDRLCASIMSIKLPSSNICSYKPELAYGISTNQVKAPTAEKLLSIAQKSLNKIESSSKPHFSRGKAKS